MTTSANGKKYRWISAQEWLICDLRQKHEGALKDSLVFLANQLNPNRIKNQFTKELKRGESNTSGTAHHLFACYVSMADDGETVELIEPLVGLVTEDEIKQIYIDKMNEDRFYDEVKWSRESLVEGSMVVMKSHTTLLLAKYSDAYSVTELTAGGADTKSFTMPSLTAIYHWLLECPDDIEAVIPPAALMKIVTNEAWIGSLHDSAAEREWANGDYFVVYEDKAGEQVEHAYQIIQNRKNGKYFALELNVFEFSDEFESPDDLVNGAIVVWGNIYRRETHPLHA